MTEAKARSMANNITISGITGDEEDEEDCTTKVKNFFTNQMEMEIKEGDVLVAHRLGQKVEGAPPR